MSEPPTNSSGEKESKAIFDQENLDSTSIRSRGSYIRRASSERDQTLVFCIRALFFAIPKMTRTRWTVVTIKIVTTQGGVFILFSTQTQR